MKRINSTLFQNSVFNIGAGKDLNPMIRFAHYSDTFIYTNLYLGFEDIFSWYKDHFEAHPDFELLDTEVVEHEAYKVVFEQDSRDGLYVKPVYPFDNQSFMKDYARVFHSASREANWLIYFEVKFKPLNKILRLYYYNGEGLATYLRLSNSGEIACRVMVTIQTGFLEFPKRELDLFFSIYAAPKIWVRGYEPSWDPHGRQLFATGYFGNEGISFNHHWTVGEYMKNTLQTRNCKGFITLDTWIALADRSTVSEWSNQHSLYRGKLEESEFLKEGDLVVLPKHLARLRGQISAKVNVIYWESLVGSKESDGSGLACSSGALEQVEALKNKLGGIDWHSDFQVHLVPFCLESEMEVYKKEVKTLPFKTVTYGLHPLDFTTWEELEIKVNQEA